MLGAERRAAAVERLAQQRLGRLELLVTLEQQREVVQRRERVRVRVAERGAPARERFAVERERLGDVLEAAADRVEIALDLQERGEVVRRRERVGVRVAELGAPALERLAEERLGVLEKARDKKETRETESEKGASRVSRTRIREDRSERAARARGHAP